MSCEICGRSSCTRSFHSLQAQQEHDEQSAAPQEVGTDGVSPASPGPFEVADEESTGPAGAAPKVKCACGFPDLPCAGIEHGYFCMDASPGEGPSGSWAPDYKVLWERDSRALGKCIQEIHTLKAVCEDWRARIAVLERELAKAEEAADAATKGVYSATMLEASKAIAENLALSIERNGLRERAEKAEAKLAAACEKADRNFRIAEAHIERAHKAEAELAEARERADRFFRLSGEYIEREKEAEEKLAVLQGEKT